AGSEVDESVDVTLGGDTQAGLVLGDGRADGLDGADELVAGDDADGDAAGGPLVPLPDVAVGAADADFFDLDEDIARAGGWLGACGVELQALAGVVLEEGAHGGFGAGAAARGDFDGLGGGGCSAGDGGHWELRWRGRRYCGGV